MEQENQPAIKQWRYSWDRFKSAGGLEKLRALLVLLRKRCPPWEVSDVKQLVHSPRLYCRGNRDLLCHRPTQQTAGFSAFRHGLPEV
jgi:hypothetical protein